MTEAAVYPEETWRCGHPRTPENTGNRECRTCAYARSNAANSTRRASDPMFRLRRDFMRTQHRRLAAIRHYEQEVATCH